MRILITLIAIGSILMQETPRVDTAMHEFIVNVVDSKGRMVDGLKASDFIIQENGVQKEISRFLPDSESPVSIGVLIDTSQSMNGSAFGARGGTSRGGSRAQSPKWAAAIGVTRAVLHLTKPQDEFQLMTFDATSKIIQPFTHDHNKIESYLRELAPVGFGTNISGAVDDSLRAMKKSANRRRGLLVITDVEDNEGGGIPALLRSLHTEETPVYIFAMRPEGKIDAGAESRGIDQTLKTVAKEGEGQNLVIDVDHLQGEQTAVKIVEFVTLFSRELRGQYTIGYRGAATGELTLGPAIRIRTVSPDLTARFRRD